MVYYIILIRNATFCGFAQKGAIIIFRVGDYVAHPGHGGCVIKEICTRCIARETKQYFLMIPETDPHTTILAPIDSIEKIGLRFIISENEANQLIEYFSELDVTWETDHNKRKQAYEVALRSSDLKAIAKMIKELLVHESETSLNHSDREILPKAQKRLFSEIALAKGVNFESAMELAVNAIFA